MKCSIYCFGLFVVNGQPKRTTISIQFSDLGFRVRSPGDLSDAELDTTLDLLYDRVTSHERLQLLQLQNVFNGLSEVAFDNCALTVKQPEESDRRSDVLKEHIRDYFQRESVDTTLEITQVHDVSVMCGIFECIFVIFQLCACRRKKCRTSRS